MRTRRAHISALLAGSWFVMASVAYAAEPSPLARARMLYNASDYDGAIAAAEMARTLPTMADAAAVVEARARLERTPPAPLDKEPPGHHGRQGEEQPQTGQRADQGKRERPRLDAEELAA